MAALPKRGGASALTVTQQMALGSIGWGLGSLSGLSSGQGSGAGKDGKGKRGAGIEAGASGNAERDGAVLLFRYVSNPEERDGVKADSRVQLLLDRLAVVYNPVWVSKLLAFQDVGESAALQLLKRSAVEHLDAAK